MAPLIQVSPKTDGQQTLRVPNLTKIYVAIRHLGDNELHIYLLFELWLMSVL